MADPKPAVVLSFDPAGPNFSISENAEMPEINVTATLQNITPDPKKPPPAYTWRVTLSSNGTGCVHSQSRVIKHPDIVVTNTQNKFTIPFSQVRGGDLDVSVSVVVGTATLTAKSEKLKVTGTNPSVAVLRTSAPVNPAFRKLMQVESGLRQFLSDTCPLFSADNFGGVGICQITYPKPSDDQVCNWKENMKAGWALYQSKQAASLAWMKSIQNGSTLKALVKAYNDARAAKSKKASATSASTATDTKGAATPPPSTSSATAVPKPLTITLPDFTDEQLQRDTIRGFNGWAGQLHEYRLKVDSDGMLVVTEDAGGTTGKAEWEQVTADARKDFYDSIGLASTRRGDPNYVEDVMGKPGF